MMSNDPIPDADRGPGRLLIGGAGYVAILLLWAGWRMRHGGRRSTRAIFGLSALSYLGAMSAPLWEAEATRAMLLARRGAP